MKCLHNKWWQTIKQVSYLKDSDPITQVIQYKTQWSYQSLKQWERFPVPVSHGLLHHPAPLGDLVWQLQSNRRSESGATTPTYSGWFWAWFPPCLKKSPDSLEVLKDFLARFSCDVTEKRSWPRRFKILHVNKFRSSCMREKPWRFEYALFRLPWWTKQEERKHNKRSHGDDIQYDAPVSNQKWRISLLICSSNTSV